MRALDSVSLTFERGEFVAIMGPSGSGKSTLLQILGTLDLPTSGKIYFEDKDLTVMNDTELSVFRRRNLGFVFQFFNLLPTLSALDNVLLPLSLDGRVSQAYTAKALELLDQVGIKSRAHHKPDQLSGGEMQRVALARALIHSPSLILADEPTGNLDTKNGEVVLSLLRDLAKATKRTIVMVTHDQNAATYSSRKILLKDGKVEGDTTC